MGRKVLGFMPIVMCEEKNIKQRYNEDGSKKIQSIFVLAIGKENI